MTPSDFWKPYEEVVSSYEELVEVIDQIQTKANQKKRQFVWRGQVNAEWALHSSLYRRLKLTKNKNPNEEELSAAEKEILKKLHQWGLHNTQGRGRLSILNQLAMLQHFDSPTRLIDVSFNAWISVFFAVEQQWKNTEESHQDADGRIFVFDVTDRIINENNSRRDWEDANSRPWVDAECIPSNEWRTSFFAWRPSSIDARIAAQNGGFIFGGVPAAVPIPEQKNRFQFPDNWGIDEGREASSLALRPHQSRATKGATPKNACYTFKIAASAKQDIRDRLKRMFGYEHSTIYPDYVGFSRFATHHLKNMP